jgi:hypothetical protein
MSSALLVRQQSFAPLLPHADTSIWESRNADPATIFPDRGCNRWDGVGKYRRLYAHKAVASGPPNPQHARSLGAAKTRP